MPISMIAVLLVVLIVRLGEAQGWLPVLVRSYADDLVVVPLVLWMIRWVHRIVRHNKNWQLPLGHGVVGVVFFLFVFEWFLPGIMGQGTADYLDGIMYCLGLVYFQLLVNRQHPRAMAVSSYPNDRPKNPVLS